MSLRVTNKEDVVGKLLRKDQQFRKEMVNAMNRAGQRFTSHQIESQMTGRPGLNTMTGRLKRSWGVKTRMIDNDLVSTIGTNVFYAKVHQFGTPSSEIADIRPKNKPFLAFRTPMGINVRYSYNKAGKLVNRSRRIWSDYVFVHKNAKCLPIRIPKRLYIPETFKTEGLALYRDEIGRQLQVVFGGK